MSQDVTIEGGEQVQQHLEKSISETLVLERNLIIKKLIKKIAQWKLRRLILASGIGIIAVLTIFKLSPKITIWRKLVRLQLEKKHLNRVLDHRGH